MKQAYIQVKKRVIYFVLIFMLILGGFSVNGAEMTKVKAADSKYGLNNPYTEWIDYLNDTVTRWDYVHFGNYWQNDTNQDGIADRNDDKEPIEWRVLAVNGDDAFLLAEQSLDSQPYHQENTDITWENCTLRSWLNEEFFENAFTSEEQDAVLETLVINEDNPEFGTEGGNDTKDKVFLLSIGEVTDLSYGFLMGYGGKEYGVTSSRSARTSRYSLEYYGMFDYGGTSYWCLRTPGKKSNYVASVRDSGSIDISGSDVCVNGRGDLVLEHIRPALHLKLSSGLWSKVEKEYAQTGGSSGETSSQQPSPTPPANSSATQKPVTVSNQTPSVASKPNSKSAVTVLPAVQKVKAKNKKKKSVTLTWKKVSGASGYQIRYSRKRNMKNSKTISVKGQLKNKKTIKKLSRRKKYYIQVRAYKKSGSKQIYGKWSAKKYFKTK